MNKKIKELVSPDNLWSSDDMQDACDKIDDLLDDREYIICSAIWYSELPMVKPEILNDFRPKNIDKGIVFSGFRHVHCLYQMVAVSGLRQCEAGDEVQGFLTSKNRFVDRTEGAAIALKSGQITALKYGNLLYSEDLY